MKWDRRRCQCGSILTIRWLLTCYSVNRDCLVRIHKGFFSRFFGARTALYCISLFAKKSVLISTHLLKGEKKKDDPFLFCTLTSKHSTWFFNFCLRITRLHLTDITLQPHTDAKLLQPDILPYYYNISLLKFPVDVFSFLAVILHLERRFGGNNKRRL